LGSCHPELIVLPGRSYTPDVIARILLRRAGLVLSLLAVGLIVAAAVSKKLPNQYRSETVIMLMRQRIPDSYVKTTVTERIEDRLASLQDQILSRSRLERIILDLNLYESLRRTLPMEDVVQRMRDNIRIKTEGKESFRVTYESVNAHTAQKTTERLASLFIEENLRDRENVAEDTNLFLDSQLEDAKRRLLEHERKVEEYKRRYSGELPSQAPTNLQAVQNAQAQLQSSAESADRARERRLLLERQIIDLQSPDPLTGAPARQAPASDAPPGGTLEQQLQQAKARLQLLLTHDKPDHPDVRAMQRTVRDLELKIAAEGPKSAEAPHEQPITVGERLRQQRIAELKAQTEEIDRQLAQKQDQDQRLRAVIADYQNKLEAVPKRESDLVELTRDYTTLQASYQSLLAKREESKIAANLERRNIGEQFKVLDPARIPERPFSPNRLAINLGGAVAGLALGLLITMFLDYRDSSFKTEEEVMRLCQLSVLAVVPLMATADEVRAQRRRRLAMGLATFALLLASAAAVMMWRPQL
jgi:polysaccharide chain length determinant protein (PEP-CTERM system associated)